jgi:integrase
MVGGEGSAGLALDASGRVFGSTCHVEVGFEASESCCKSEKPSKGTPKCEADKNKRESEVRAACHLLEGTAAGASAQIPACPNNCQSGKIYRDGLRYSPDGSSVQRWLCTFCGTRFIDKALKSKTALTMSRQICAKEAKNLPFPARTRRVGTGEVTPKQRQMLQDFKDWMQKEGYKPNCYANNLLTLIHIGADLNNPEDVKAKIASHTVKDSMKMMFCYSYETYLRMKEMSWIRPTANGKYKLVYRQEVTDPFIPERSELDQLNVAPRSHRMMAFLKTLDDTFTDPGEALRIERRDIQGRNITIRYPVKGHRARTIEVSEQCIYLINQLPVTDSPRIFNCTYRVMQKAFATLKHRLYQKTGNERFLYIELRSYRHFAGTRIAELSNGNHYTVMKMLGLKSLKNTEKYVNIWKLSFRTETEMEYLCVTTPEELKVALLGNYQHVIDKFGASWFRRPKRIAIAGTPIPLRPDQPQSPSLEEPINKTENDVNKSDLASINTY